MSRVTLGLGTVVAAMLLASAGFGAEQRFSAALVGTEEVPAVATAATGDVSVTVSSDGETLHYRLQVEKLENIRVAHIHRGMQGANGPPVVFLFSGPKKPGMFSGVLAEGTITARELSGEFAGKTLDELLQLITTGNAYVNVHTDAHPGGEIRGQLR
ncbi:CHRD domain-containing protein [Trichlorobacter ammonificans]|uniref:CHRD domain-containing protein n=1 Tax=Trichlorobacter ammonificans TaxID=2916410 RepID=A0ABN8HIW7_9BACT|nr:CHRD domain-containing protein [Trichlorobacter ammonificans]CAH2030948.1 CHRD domain-containing protein [Trichlorobacter ammonificans]